MKPRKPRRLCGPTFDRSFPSFVEQTRQQRSQVFWPLEEPDAAILNLLCGKLFERRTRLAVGLFKNFWTLFLFSGLVDVGSGSGASGYVGNSKFSCKGMLQGIPAFSVPIMYKNVLKSSASAQIQFLRVV